jgi:hypothetical protein
MQSKFHEHLDEDDLILKSANSISLEDVLIDQYSRSRSSTTTTSSASQTSDSSLPQPTMGARSHSFPKHKGKSLFRRWTFSKKGK